MSAFPGWSAVERLFNNSANYGTIEKYEQEKTSRRDANGGGLGVGVVGAGDGGVGGGFGNGDALGSIKDPYLARRNPVVWNDLNSRRQNNLETEHANDRK